VHDPDLMDLPVLLLAEFRKIERAESIAVLMANDGFDVAAMRVLSAWTHTQHLWKMPKKPCPDAGRATPASWAWLCSGWQLDFEAITEGADVARLVAVAKVELLQRNHLIYPDGQMSLHAQRALRLHVTSRLKAAAGKGKAKDKEDDDGPKRKDPEVH
jgi:hypothetical protein